MVAAASTTRASRPKAIETRTLAQKSLDAADRPGEHRLPGAVLVLTGEGVAGDDRGDQRQDPLAREAEHQQRHREAVLGREAAEEACPWVAATGRRRRGRRRRERSVSRSGSPSSAAGRAACAPPSGSRRRGRPPCGRSSSPGRPGEGGRGHRTTSFSSSRTSSARASVSMKNSASRGVRVGVKAEQRRPPHGPGRRRTPTASRSRAGDDQPALRRRLHEHGRVSATADQDGLPVVAGAQQVAGVGCHGAQVVDGAVEGHRAPVHDRDVVADLLDLVHVVRGEQHRQAAGREPLHERPHVADAPRVEPLAGSSSTSRRGLRSRLAATPRRCRMP